MAVGLSESDWPGYKGWNNTIYIPEAQYRLPPSKWSRTQWANYSNELFHAWWDIVFEEEADYRKRIREEVNALKKAGIIIEIPSD